ncbi:hypothetical protein HUE57_12430 [Candidatus Reidiella endopervernicosa]|uniref:Guanylate cyclase domain-containing protein n=1 Tax=Candidatus Reidiella endopervernicosa TaxID=2738883 RepID=A0A6N0HXA9_9GAMM|nr:hypothetical protein HUE57_12430 [Candidatus Reidiella endopervernicosa]
MVASGLPTPRPDHAEALVNMGIDMQRAVDLYNTNSNQHINIRIGINSGPVVAGVIGEIKFIYDLWGDTVNIASRMESHGVEGRIQVSETTRDLLPDHFQFEDRGAIQIKGKGEMNTYLIVS